MDREFTASSDLSTDIAYAESYLEICARAGVIDASVEELKQIQVFPKNY